MAQISWLVRHNQTIESIRDLYLETNNQKKTASKLHIDIKTLRKYLRKAGITFRRGRKKLQNTQSKHYGCLPSWIRKNPEIKLPRNIKSISSITGCSIFSIHGYMNRRIATVQNFIDSLPDLRKINIIFSDKNGNILSTKLIESIKYSIDNFTFKIKMECKLRFEKTVNIILSMKQLKTKIQQNQDQLKQMSPIETLHNTDQNPDNPSPLQDS